MLLVLDAYKIHYILSSVTPINRGKMLLLFNCQFSLILISVLFMFQNLCLKFQEWSDILKSILSYKTKSNHHAMLFQIFDKTGTLPKRCNNKNTQLLPQRTHLLHFWPPTNASPLSCFWSTAWRSRTYREHT